MWRLTGPNLTDNIVNIIKELPPQDFAKLSEAQYYPFDRKNPAPKLAPLTDPPKDTCITVENIDCMKSAVDLVLKHKCKKVGILNMANEYNVGGGFERVRGSQEEYLFRASSVCLSLFPHRRQKTVECAADERWSVGTNLLNSRALEVKEMGMNIDTAGPDVKAFYPLTECGGIATPFVEPISTMDASTTFMPLAQRRADFHSALCKSRGESPDEVKQQLQMSDHLCMLSIAAQDLRTNTSHYKGEKYDHEWTKEKFRTALHMAVLMNCDALVLGAIGCGAFHNPKEMVAKAFKELLEGEFKGRFERVVFAIVFSDENLNAFQKVLCAL